jgi:hypothetical protein
LRGKESGLHLTELMELQTRETFLPTAFSEKVATTSYPIDFEEVMRNMVGVCV